MIVILKLVFLTIYGKEQVITNLQTYQKNRMLLFSCFI